MDCVACGSVAVTERPDRTAQGYRRFRCREYGKQYNERSDTLLNHAQYPSNVIVLVVLWRLRYRLTLRDLSEMFLVRGSAFSHEAVRDWEATNSATSSASAPATISTSPPTAVACFTSAVPTACSPFSRPRRPNSPASHAVRFGASADRTRNTRPFGTLLVKPGNGPNCRRPMVAPEAIRSTPATAAAP